MMNPYAEKNRFDDRSTAILKNTGLLPFMEIGASMFWRPLRSHDRRETFQCFLNS